MKGPHPCVEMHYPKSRGNIEGWASIRQNQGATPRAMARNNEAAAFAG